MIWNRIKDSRLFLLSSILFSLALCYPQKLGFLVFIFLTPVLFYLDRNKKSSNIRLFGNMFVFSFVCMLVSTLWFLSVFPLDWLKITDPLLSIFIIVPFWLSFLMAMSLIIAFWPPLVKKIQTGQIFVDAFLGASLWVLIEYLRSWVLAVGVYGDQTLFGPHYTYYSVAYPVSNIPIVHNLFPFGGMYLVSFFIIFSNYFFYYCFAGFKSNKDLKGIFLSVLFLASLLFFSTHTLQYIRKKESISSPFVMTVVNMHELVSHSSLGAKERIRKALSLVSSMNNPDGIIIFPENVNIVTPFLEGEIPKDTFTFNLAIGSFTGNQFYNMYFFTQGDRKVEYYRKQLLMPIGEYNVSWIDFLIQKSSLGHWTNIYNAVKHTHKKGSSQSVFSYQKIDGLIFGGSLCSENISPYIYRNATILGSTVLLNIASHAPFHGSNLLARQTLAINTARALENGRYFITSSNYSPSFVITDEGDLIYVSKDSKKESFDNVLVVTKKYITPYVKYGDYVVFLAFIILSLRIIWIKKNS